MKGQELIKLFFFFFLLILASCQSSDSAEESHGTYELGTKVSGLQGDVYCGYFDREGQLWFGTTSDGLYRYDGNSLVHYTQQDGLSDNKISSITQDNKGNIWLGTASGICIFNGQKFSHLNLPPYDTITDWLKQSYPVVNPNEVQSIHQDKQGSFWFGTNGAGAYRYDGHTFTHLLDHIGRKQPDSLYHNIIQSITEDHSGNLWFASMTHGGVIRYDGDSFRQIMPDDGISDDMVRTIFVDKAGNIWFGFNGNRNSGLTRYDGTSFQTYTVGDGLCTRNIRAIYQDPDGNLWIGGFSGMCLFDGQKFTVFKGEDGRIFDRIVFIVGDAEGAVWFGGKNGLWQFKNGQVIDWIDHQNQ